MLKFRILNLNQRITLYCILNIINQTNLKTNIKEKQSLWKFTPFTVIDIKIKWLNSRADVTNLSLIGSTPQRGINTIEIWFQTEY